MPPLLTLTSVSVRHQRGHRSVQALRDANLELFAGELAGVWGRRGSGKTTLAHVVAGIMAPDSGTVALDGASLHDVSRRDRRGVLHAQIGLATRRGPDVDGIAVEDWIASALLTSHGYREALKVARCALERTRADHLGSEPWDDLSDGERMLVAVAQAIVRGPRVLVVDDPLAGAGAVERDEMMGLLHAIASAGVAVLMTAAELIELRGADRIWGLREGQLDRPTTRAGGTVVPLRTAYEQQGP